jgi:separase
VCDVLTRSRSPSLVANLWDVTDRDIDRLSEAVFHKLHLDASHVPDVKAKTLGVMPLSEMSTVQAVNASREDCKLKYLTGAAPVVYGLPVYLH